MSRDISILVINPNSSTSMTAALQPLLSDLVHPHLRLEFYTAPASAPPSINDEETTKLSTSETLPHLLEYLLTKTQEPRFAAYLVACYSDHPLTSALQKAVNAPVLNILQASVLHAKMLGRPFGTVTTGTYWEPVLQNATRLFLLGTNPEAGVGKGLTEFVGVRSTGLSATELHSTSREEVNRRISEATGELVQKGARIILLGCAGMSGMDEAVRAGAEQYEVEVTVIDGVRAGVVLLEGLVRSQNV